MRRVRDDGVLSYVLEARITGHGVPTGTGGRHRPQLDSLWMLNRYL